jgi:hypothetical protein
MTDDSMISRRAILVAMAGGLLGVPLAAPAPFAPKKGPYHPPRPPKKRKR